MTGVLDESENLEGGTSDEDKLRKIWAKVGVNEEIVIPQARCERRPK